jgi:hypothetical protein
MFFKSGYAFKFCWDYEFNTINKNKRQRLFPAFNQRQQQ